MPWVPFTEADVTSRLAAREIEVYEATSRREYPEEGGEAEVPVLSPERLPQIVEQVCNQFRGAIRGNPLVSVLGPAGTLPDFCIAHAAVIARVALVGMNPVPEGMTDPRRDEYREANSFLRSLRTAPAAMFDDADPAPAPACPAFGGNPYLDF
ncbi:hypothetical protein OKA04_12895 [Luteolibacter flavescens]|uniref:DUF1320 domain-containing protein n=1 Tax=Luteolibacter flavescens TaxID=1859460 RepID=A0ABT3FQP2_9BACT|nr:hypothetical protein [Luteolibacter flavescens]MCW1885629.1 hypothetical protein [Luteolibacter flavescens]